jgi:regulator of replication initiation timing
MIYLLKGLFADTQNLEEEISEIEQKLAECRAAMREFLTENPEFNYLQQSSGWVDPEVDALAKDILASIKKDKSCTK